MIGDQKNKIRSSRLHDCGLVKTDQKDLKHFYTHPLKFSMFSIDSTCIVGNFYVSSTCFQNFKIAHADGRYRGRLSYVIGPTFIHTEKSKQQLVFFCSLLRINQNLKTIQALGSDGYEAFWAASIICFQDAPKLLCSTQKRTIFKES